MPKAKKHLATITILVKDRQMHAGDVQKILTENGHLILARLGVNVQRACIKHCTGFITIAVEGTANEIRDLTKKLDKLYGIAAKSCIMTD
jgi:metal-responsive CopG/Arc/MetJ family transcriptional regulator